MIFISDSQGTITAVLPTPLNQGSNNVNTAVLVAPFPESNVISVAFTLPNGQYISPRMGENEGAYSMTNVPGFSGKFYDDNGAGYNAWSIELDYPLLTFSGDLTIQFFVSSSHGTMATSASTFTVQRGNPVLPSNPPSAEQWELIVQAVAAAQQAEANAQDSEDSAAASADSASASSASAEASAAIATGAKDVAVQSAQQAVASDANIDAIISGAGLKPTPGLRYTLIGDSAYYVSIGEATDQNIVIAAIYNGLPVTTIEATGFQSSPIRSVFIPKTIVYIGDYAFQYCGNLERVIIPSSVVGIGVGAFKYCVSLKAVRLGDYFPIGGPILWDEGTPQLAAPYIYAIGDTLYINDASEEATSFDIIADGEVVATI